MTTRKRVVLGIIAILGLMTVACCISVYPSLFPAVPPPQLELIREGMPFKEVGGIYGREHDHDSNEDAKKDTKPWVACRVHEGSIVAQRDEQGLVVQRHFQASCSSLVEELQSVWELIRKILCLQSV